MAYRAHALLAPASLWEHEAGMVVASASGAPCFSGVPRVLEIEVEIEIEPSDT